MKIKIVFTLFILYLIIYVCGNDEYDYDSESIYNDSDDSNDVSIRKKEDEYLEKLRRVEMENDRKNSNENNYNFNTEFNHEQNVKFNRNSHINRNNPYVNQHMNNRNGKKYNNNDLLNLNRNLNDENSIYDEYLGSRKNIHNFNNDHLDMGLNDRMEFNNGNIDGNFHTKRTNQFQNHNNINNGMNANNPMNNIHNNQNQNNSYFSSSFFTSMYEYLSLIFVFGFIYRCIFMRNSNDNTIKYWYGINKKLFKDNFSYESFYEYNEQENRLIEKLVSFEDNETNLENINEVSKYPILKRSNTVFEYKVYNDDEDESAIKEMTINIEFKKNQDYLFLVTQFIFNNKDAIKYEAVVDYSIDYPSIFIIGNEKEVGYILNQNSEFNTVCKDRYCITLIDKKVCACEDRELIDCILNEPEIANTLKIISQLITLLMFLEATGCKK